MSSIDWIVLCITIASIVIYGMWKSRDTKDIRAYLLANQELPWYHVGLSVMATQASAITFLSAPGQAYSDGLRFIQFYFGLPLAMVLLCVTFIPIFKKLNVYTAYEYLEKRFDNKTRTLTAFLFLLQRGLSTGITLYAPAIILSVILSVDISYTILFIGALVITYTVYGGTRAVSYTQLFQMMIIFSGLFLATFMVVHLLPEGVGFTDALHVAGKMEKMNAIDTQFDLNNKYNIWSGIIGGFFLQLSYFGTDQSQVGRYLTGSSVNQSRMGLIMNGLVKIPMQFLILLIGTLVFSFYQFYPPPVFFNRNEIVKIEASSEKDAYKKLEKEFQINHEEKRKQVHELVNALHENNEEKINGLRVNLQAASAKSDSLKKEVTRLMPAGSDTNDSNYVFLSFVTEKLPVGIVGLLVAIIFLAAMGSSAGGLNSLASTTMVDFYQRFGKNQGKSKSGELAASRWATVVWGVFCVIVALFASRLGNLIEAVNILGSWFYGTILGVFLVAFYLKKVNGNQVFVAALFAEAVVIYCWIIDLTAFLWLNVIGCLLVMALGVLFQQMKWLEKRS